MSNRDFAWGVVFLSVFAMGLLAEDNRLRLKESAAQAGGGIEAPEGNRKGNAATILQAMGFLLAGVGLARRVRTD